MQNIGPKTRDVLALVLRQGVGVVLVGIVMGSTSDMEVMQDAGAQLDELGVDSADDLVLRREVSDAGRSRCWVNDTSVTAGALQRIAPHLLSIHGQHEQYGLAESAVQRGLVDQYGELGDLVEKVAAAHGVWVDAAAEVDFGWGRPTFRAELAKALLERGMVNEAKRAIAEAKEALTQTRELWWEPEVLRIEGDALLAEGDRHAAEAEDDHGVLAGQAPDRDRVAELFARGQVDVLVHLAAMAGVRPSLADPLAYQDVNVRGTVILLEELRRFDLWILVPVLVVPVLRCLPGDQLTRAHQAVGRLRELRGQVKELEKRLKQELQPALNH